MIPALVKKSVAVALTASLATLYYLADPSASAWFPKCPLHMLTGLECAGCGSQRAIHALLHADIAEAWHHNPLLLLLLPYLALLAFTEIRPATGESGPGARITKVIHHPAMTWTIVTAIVAWSVVRNIR